MMPVLPSKTPPELDQLAIETLTASAALGKGIHPATLEEVARFMLRVNSYYTNAMEGNPSKLRDIEAALNRDLSKDKIARNYQLEHLAHIQVQEAMIGRLREEPGLRIGSEAFLCWLHEQFFSRLPREMRIARTVSGEVVPLEPGRLRDRGITVGHHQGPETRAEIQSCLSRFESLLSPESLAGPQKILGMASSHHRILWVHPFPEGNGRVARLFTTAFGFRIGVGDNMLWTVSRAFAGNRSEYDAHLVLADQTRRNDLDGRGPLSEENLIRWCGFFLRCCKDQMDYMSGVLRLEELERRYKLFLNILAGERRLSKAGSRTMDRLLVQGRIPRSQVLGIAGVKQRRASQIIRELLKANLARSETAYGPLRLNISVEMAAVLFPALT